MIYLRLGSHDPHVTYLQRLLNQAFVNDRTAEVLEEDSQFGRKTDTALRRFQAAYRGAGAPLAADGIAGPKTWRALGLHVEVNWPLPRVGQTTGMTCWVVSAGLATGRMTSAVPATAEFAPLSQPGGGGLLPDLDNLDRFARDLNMHLLPLVPMTAEALLPYLRRGPAILIGRWVSGGLHAVVVSGYFGAGRPYTTMVRINNSLPMGRGSIELTQYPGMYLGGDGFDPYALIAR